MKLSLRIFGLIGFMLFSSGFGLTFSVPGFVEDIGKTFIKNTIIEKTQEKINTINHVSNNPSFKKLLGKLSKNNQDHIDRYKTQLKNNAHEKIAEVIAQMSDLSCECRKKYSAMIKENFLFNITSLNHYNERLTDFMKGKYMDVSQKLKKDFRIFTGANALVFLLLIVVSFIKPKAAKHLLLPGFLLLVSSLVCSYFYLFQQNWFFTIIYDSYVGWFYLIYFGVVFAVLCDIVLNRGKITTAVLDNTIGAISDVSFELC